LSWLVSLGGNYSDLSWARETITSNAIIQRDRNQSPSTWQATLSPRFAYQTSRLYPLQVCVVMERSRDVLVRQSLRLWCEHAFDLLTVRNGDQVIQSACRAITPHRFGLRVSLSSVRFGTSWRDMATQIVDPEIPIPGGQREETFFFLHGVVSFGGSHTGIVRGSLPLWGCE